MLNEKVRKHSKNQRSEIECFEQMEIIPNEPRARKMTES